MTKQYLIVHIGNEMYMIDKERYARISSMITNGETVETVTYFDTVTLEYTVGDTKHRRVDATKYSKILASTDKSLGLPLLPAVEDNINQLAKDYAKDLYQKFEGKKDGTHILLEDNAEIDFKAGYRANTKKWSDEDMLKAWQAGIAATKATPKETVFFEQFLESLRPKPIAVEVEVIPACSGLDTPEFVNRDINNFVKVVKWIYEHSSKI